MFAVAGVSRILDKIHIANQHGSVSLLQKKAEPIFHHYQSWRPIVFGDVHGAIANSIVSIPHPHVHTE